MRISPFPNQTSPSQRFQLLTLAQLRDLPSPEMLVAGVVRLGGLSMTQGEPASFKSFVALDLALSVATGLPWHGHAVRRSPVIYVSGEGSSGLPSRAEAWLSERDIAAPTNFWIIPEAVSLVQPDDVVAVIGQATELEEPPGLIVLDTFARCTVGADENSAKNLSR